MSSPDTLDNIAIESISDIDRHFEALAKDRWIVDIAKMSRGSLLEAQVELEAEPLFGMATVITTLYELMADRPDIFGTVPTGQLKEINSVGQVLDRLLAGLVPVRGRLMDFETIKIGDREILAHLCVKEKLGEKYTDDFMPVYITGVAHQGLFWKDIRQILFSKSQYSVFCRLVTKGLKKDWQPVKLVDVFEGIVPEFKEAMNSASEMARQMMKGQSNVEAGVEHQDENLGIALVKEYVHHLEEFHQEPVSPHLMEHRIIPTVPSGNWHMSVTDRRAVLDEITDLVEKELGKETPGETRLSLRNKVFKDMDPAEVLSSTTFAHTIEPPKSGQEERFLDTEIVAIYW